MNLTLCNSKHFHAYNDVDACDMCQAESLIKQLKYEIATLREQLILALTLGVWTTAQEQERNTGSLAQPSLLRDVPTVASNGTGGTGTRNTMPQPPDDTL